MQPKSFCVKTSSREFINLLDKELSTISSFRYIKKKINGEYFIILKCFNYYERFNKVSNYSFYGSYIYLYTNVSLILSDLIISYYERILSKRIINMYYFYFSQKEQKQIHNIATSLLDPCFCLDESKIMYFIRKEKILNNLLLNFRKQNYINIDSFINFSLTNYMNELEEIIDQSVRLFLADKSYANLIKFIFQNLLY